MTNRVLCPCALFFFAKGGDPMKEVRAVVPSHGAEESPSLWLPFFSWRVEEVSAFYFESPASRMNVVETLKESSDRGSGDLKGTARALSREFPDATWWGIHPRDPSLLLGRFAPSSSVDWMTTTAPNSLE